MTITAVLLLQTPDNMHSKNIVFLTWQKCTLSHVSNFAPVCVFTKHLSLEKRNKCLVTCSMDVSAKAGGNICLALDSHGELLFTNHRVKSIDLNQKPSITSTNSNQTSKLIPIKTIINSIQTLHFKHFKSN